MELTDLNQKEHLIDKDKNIKDHINNIHTKFSNIIESYENKNKIDNKTLIENQDDIKSGLINIELEMKCLLDALENYTEKKGKVRKMLYFILFF